MADELLTKTPLSLHPQVLETLGTDHQDDPVVSVARDALATARGSWQATLTGHAKVMSDPTRTEAANMQRSADAAQRRQTEALQRLDSAVERVQREISFIDDSLAAAVEPPAPHVTSLIANRLSGMTADARHKVISAAIAADDRATLGAVLHVGPAWLYGLSDVERNMYLHSFRAERFPQALARRAALERAAELVKNGGSSLMVAHAKMYNRKALDDAAARARQAEEALGD
jgi:hypothetical protein